MAGNRIGRDGLFGSTEVSDMELNQSPSVSTTVRTGTKKRGKKADSRGGRGGRGSSSPAPGRRP